MRFNINYDGRCYHCKCRPVTAPHEPLMGNKYRKLSINHNLVIGVCDECHRLLHSDDKLNTVYKQEMQRIFEREHGHEEWMRVFGRNYL